MGSFHMGEGTTIELLKAIRGLLEDQKRQTNTVRRLIW
jgi:hypothetical protein